MNNVMSIQITWLFFREFGFYEPTFDSFVYGFCLAQQNKIFHLLDPKTLIQ
jgi:hypothetical protein